MTHHVLKVLPPYFQALQDGSKPFDVRRNDRAFQCGDTITFYEHDGSYNTCDFDCGHLFHRDRSTVERVISFVFSGDPRFKGLEPNHVVLGLQELAQNVSQFLPELETEDVVTR